MTRLLPLLILRAASLLVPRNRRAEWLREWQSELWYVSPQVATRFCLGSFRDALWLRGNSEELRAASESFLSAPLRCLAFLAFVSGASGVLAVWLEARLPFRQTNAMTAPAGIGSLLFFLAILLGIALTFREWPGKHHALRSWIFLALKLTFILPILYCALVVMAVIAPLPLGPQAVLVGCIMLLRWVFVDQCRRCPKCLRSLTKPVRMGAASDTVLEWYGNESICTAGHGLMQVGAGSTSFHGSQTWLKLDESWSGLFPNAERRRP